MNAAQYLKKFDKFLTILNGLEARSNDSWLIQDDDRSHRAPAILDFLGKNFNDHETTLHYVIYTGSGMA